MGVREAAICMAVEGVDAVLNRHPFLTREDMEAAARFAKALPRPAPRWIPRPDREFLVSEVKADLHAAA